MSPTKFVIAALVAATVAGCAADPNAPNQNAGAVGGAIAGGVLGALVGGHRAGDRLAGAVIGAAAGGLIGSAIGASLDERDRQMAYEAEMRALESGPPNAPVAWRSDHTAYYGTIVPGPYYVETGRRCRHFTHTVYIRGRPEVVRGTACREPDGRWVAVS
jgi:surface antigen